MKKNYKLVFYIVTVTFWAAMYSHVSILPGYAESLKATAQMIGIITGSYGFMQFLLRLPLGILSDKVQKRKIFITGAMVSSFAAGIVMFLTPSPLGLLLGRILCGISACSYVQITILYSSYHEEGKLAKSMGIMVSLMYLSQMLAMLIGGIVTDSFDVKYTFLLTSLFALTGLVLSFFIYDKPIEREPIKMRELRHVISNKWLIAASLLAILCQALSFAKSWSFVPLAAYRYGAAGLMQSVITVSFTFFSMLSALLSGKLAAKIGEKRLLAIGFMLHGLGSIVIILWQSVAGLVVSQIIAGFGNGFVFSLLMSLSLQTIPEHRRGSAMGMYQGLYAIGMFAGPFVFGSFADQYPLNYGFIATAVLAFIGFGLVFLLFSTKNSERAHAQAVK